MISGETPEGRHDKRILRYDDKNIFNLGKTATAAIALTEGEIVESKFDDQEKSDN